MAAKHPRMSERHLEEGSVENLTWESLLRRSLELPVSTDEHVFKLVHVCYVRSIKNPSARMGGIYKRACLTAIETEGFNT